MEIQARDRLTPPPIVLANPVGMYAGLWLSVLGLFQLHLLNMLKPMNASAFWLIMGSVGLAVVMMFAVWALMPRLLPYTAERELRELHQLYAWRKWALRIWAVGSVFEIFASKGLPIVWLIVGDHTRDYRDFGVNSLHGLMMGLLFSCISVTAIEIFLHGRARRWWLMGALLVWTVMLMSRGSLVWALLQITAIYLLTRRIRPRVVAGLGVAVLAGVLAFGVLGDLRGLTSKSAFDPLLAPAARPIARVLPSGFLWVYLYTTTPINNIVGSIETLEPEGTLYFSVAPLLPTVLRQWVFNDPDKKYPLGLVSKAFNTSTWFVNFLADFGVAGALAATSLLMLIAILCYRSARAWRPWAIVGYGVCFQGVLLSVFADTFTSLVTLSQLLIVVGLQSAAALAARKET